MQLHRSCGCLVSGGVLVIVVQADYIVGRACEARLSQTYE